VNIAILLSGMVVAACKQKSNEKKDINEIVRSINRVNNITWIEYTAESYRMWNVRKSDINMTERKRAANLGRETPTIIKQSDSGPAGITVALDNHLESEMKNSSVF
jgi:hypothetical protein